MNEEILNEEILDILIEHCGITGTVDLDDIRLALRTKEQEARAEAVQVYSAALVEAFRAVPPPNPQDIRMLKSVTNVIQMTAAAFKACS